MIAPELRVLQGTYDGVATLRGVVVETGLPIDEDLGKHAVATFPEGEALVMQTPRGAIRVGLSGSSPVVLPETYREGLAMVNVLGGSAHRDGAQMTVHVAFEVHLPGETWRAMMSFLGTEMMVDGIAWVLEGAQAEMTEEGRLRFLERVINDERGAVPGTAPSTAARVYAAELLGALAAHPEDSPVGGVRIEACPDFLSLRLSGGSRLDVATTDDGRTISAVMLGDRALRVDCSGEA